MDNIEIINAENDQYFLVNDIKINIDLFEKINNKYRKCGVCKKYGLKSDFYGKRCYECKKEYNREHCKKFFDNNNGYHKKYYKKRT